MWASLPSHLADIFIKGENIFSNNSIVSKKNNTEIMPIINTI
jgi:hypothetical protein